MLCVKVPKASAEEIRNYLARHNLMDTNYRIIGGNEFIYFPISGRDAKLAHFADAKEAEIVRRNFRKSDRKIDYRKMLMDELGADYEESRKGYDLVGDIAIIEPATEINKKALAKAIMKSNKGIRTVLAKGGPVRGKYRIRTYKYVAGKRRYRTRYRENGVVLELDLRRSFFSTRLAFERDRIRRLVKKGENVCVMFAGVGPFAIEIAKRRKDSSVLAIELNKNAYRDMLANIKLNKADNVAPELGDVNKVAGRHRGFADRIVMPLPKDSYDFLDAVLKVAKRRCIVHYYAFGNRADAFERHIRALRGFFEKRRTGFRVIFKRVVRQYSPSEIEIVIDFMISR